MPDPPPKREAGKVSASSLHAIDISLSERNAGLRYVARAEQTLKQQALRLSEQGMSKTALAEALGVSRQTVYNWIKEAKR